MMDYRRMGDMEQHYLRNATSTTSFLHQLRDLWKSPRGTVLRIEALALVAIAFSFLVVALGACRRWSKRWIIQKGFLAANVLSVSLGTYSIGLMQSSLVKNEMYPVWAVSLLTLFGCVDPVTSYNGLDYKGPLSKMVFQLCLYCGYVLLISISTISSDVGNIAIGVLSAVNFFKGFHRSLALVLPRRMRKMIRRLKSDGENNAISDLDDYDNVILFDLVVDFPLDMDDPKQSFYSILSRDGVLRNNINSSCEDMVKLRINVGDCHDGVLRDGVRLAKLLLDRGVGSPWKLLEAFWVQALLYAAPYGDVEVHMEHLSKGGELITHLWALLYHAHIYSWQTVETWGGKPETEEVEENPRDGGQRKDDLNTCSNADDNPRTSLPLQGATDVRENSMDMSDSEVEIEDDVSSSSKDDDNPRRISVPVQADIRWT